MAYGIYEEQCLLQERERKNQYDRIPDMLKGLFGKTGDNVFVEPPFFCDYGSNIEVGENFFANYNCTILDVAKVKSLIRKHGII